MKYEFTDETKVINGTTLHRIKATKDFGGIKQGDLGGWIEEEENLSQEGNAKVYGGARVYGDAEIYDNAKVCCKAYVCGDAKVFSINNVLVIGAIGSRNDYTTFYLNKGGEIFVRCGCFNGSIDDFLQAVEETHGGNRHAVVYKAAIELAKLQITPSEVWDNV